MDKEKTTYPSDPVVECLSAKREEMGVTMAWIAEKSGVPESTVTKVFNRSIKNPTFDTLAPIAEALDISLDTLTTIRKETFQKSSVQGIQHGNRDEIFLRMLIESYDRQMKNKDRWIIVLASLFIVIFVSLIAAIVYDVTHPHMGWVQYTAYMKESVGRLTEVFRL